MAQRKVAAAPAKQKLRKMHGPKRKMFHDYDSTARLQLAGVGLLDKYHNFESFAQFCAAKGVKKNVDALWNQFNSLTMRKTASGEWISVRKLQEKFFQEISDKSAALEESTNKGKKSLPKSKK